MKVPFIDLKRHLKNLRSDIDSAVARVLDSAHFILGPEVKALEGEVSGFVGARHAIGASSGTDALALSMMACKVGPGDLVVTTPFTFFATASAIYATGARPVFADIDRTTLNLDPAQLEKLLKSPAAKKVKAVMPVHLFGLMADMKGIRKVAGDLPVIEDACQAIGATRDGMRAGSAGTAAAFSFFPTKNLGGFGDGGMVTTNDETIAGLVRRLSQHGSSEKNLHDRIGINGRLDALQAAILRIQLPTAAEANERRRRLGRRYTEAFREIPFITCPSEPPGAQHIYHHYTILVGDGRRDELQTFLSSRGIGCQVYYPVPVHLQPAAKELGFGRGAFPVAEQCADQVLSLPVFPTLTEEEQDQVIRSIREFAGAR
jgi:dTDP-4-amino-4,6-dideoxygalactose transaminase